MNRVVVTGMGIVSPIGNDIDNFMKNLFASKNGISKITKFDASKTGITVAGEVKEFDPLIRLDRKFAKRNDLFCSYALYSAKEAMEMSGLNETNIQPEELGVIYGSGIGGLTTIQNQVIKMYDKGVKRVSPLFVPNSIINMAAGNISIAFNAKNTSQGIVTACSSGTNAIGDAYEYIKQGKATALIAGGTEASINEMGISGFASLTALSREKDPLKASIPFDKNRTGFVLGEGAATIVLEDYKHAKNRGAKILAEVVGYGTTSDAYHMTAPNPDGEGAARAMVQAIAEAEISEKDIDYINAHGTSTAANDSAESKAINKVFVNNNHLKVSSTKGMTGHALGAAGAIEAVASILSIKNNQMPVNVGLMQQDDECNIELVNEDNKKAEINYVMSNSFGFGGHNAVIIFRGV
ncbi:beta-ketoacyl-ACP synthase II [Companilactobacillus musae]|uniref:beta-ketoacyl-ACP synthase II n=1 Tax=Companilactobacillus musae TaxID=1903258 RepID=UPI000E652B1C|nr:beta-ketoacyl-ACP synthase II [Companilactobacillus musae]